VGVDEVALEEPLVPAAPQLDVDMRQDMEISTTPV
jgi:hypothetical protein